MKSSNLETSGNGPICASAFPVIKISDVRLLSGFS